MVTLLQMSAFMSCIGLCEHTNGLAVSRQRPMGPRILGTLTDKLPTRTTGGHFFGPWGWVCFQNQPARPSRAPDHREACATDSAREWAFSRGFVAGAAV